LWPKNKRQEFYGKTFMSEIDAVCQKDGNILVVSCKVSKNSSETVNCREISANASVIARFSIPLLISWYNHSEKGWDLKEKIPVIGPDIFLDEIKFKNWFHEYINTLYKSAI
jgi:hypothetical protein